MHSWRRDPEPNSRPRVPCYHLDREQRESPGWGKGLAWRVLSGIEVRRALRQWGRAAPLDRHVAGDRSPGLAGGGISGQRRRGYGAPGSAAQGFGAAQTHGLSLIGLADRFPGRGLRGK
jgi:hypothetical protein